jgi:peptidoglycan/xylan/chitin deacetylase (PgdA/CDA1 family)
VSDLVLPARVAWAEGLPLTLPPALMHLLTTPAPDDDASSAARRIANELRLRAAFTDTPPASARLPFSYQTIPGPLRRLMANAIGRLQRVRQQSWARYPGWPLDLSADVAADLAGAGGIVFARTPVLVTHDIDSPEGLRNLRDMFLPVEEAVGARSANYLVPCAWPVDAQLVQEVAARGHEIGVHGYDHANRTAFVPEQERRARLAAGHEFARRYGGVGYRAPSLLRTQALIDDLRPLYRYDSSIPTSGGAFPVPNNGCASARPWQFGTLWELPLSMPRDGSLRFLGHSAAAIGALWRDTATRIARSGGMVCLLTHCEAGFSGNPPMLAQYRDFLEWVAARPQFEFIRPMDLVDRLDRDHRGD